MDKLEEPAVYVDEGFTVVVSSGGTETPGLPSMTPIAPPTPNPSNSECNNLTSANYCCGE